MVLLARIITHYTVFFQLFAEFVGSRVTIFRLHSQAEHLDAPPF
ncbi:4-hydroxybenzoate octaprenyltransferase [Nodularia spumigena CCY9414]|nr:4-hydroxybenzoate octaprenyltransferase [Nodularia spumigena CCY9414]